MDIEKYIYFLSISFFGDYMPRSVGFERVCEVALKAIKPYLGKGREVLIALCKKDADITHIIPGNYVIGGDKTVRGILYCPRGGRFWGSVHNHPTRPDIPSFIDIYQYLIGSLGGYMCIASEATGCLSCYWLTKKYHASEVAKLVRIVNKAARAYNTGDFSGYRRFVIEAKKFMMNYRCCRIRWKNINTF
mgnify:CR=1 FL=1